MRRSAAYRPPLSQSGARHVVRRLPDDRRYTTSTAPLLSDDQGSALSSPQLEVALAVYQEIAAVWRSLTDVRFKLLALVPAVSALGLVAALAPGPPLGTAGTIIRVGLAAFGLLVTLGLYVYDCRNNDLYNDLISRGRRAERDLGIHTGVFLGRKDPRRYRIGRVTIRPVSHSVALRLVYGTVCLSWLAAAVMLTAGIAPG